MDKFSDKYLNNHHILRNAICGFEFEFFTEKSYYKLLEYLNNDFRSVGIKFHGFRKYHSSMKPDEYNFKIEPDFSGGYSMVEAVTGPMTYYDAKIILLKFLKFLQENAETDEKCSVHINISFDKEKSPKILDQLNPLKLILNIDENLVYKYFPERKNNIYASSIKKLIPFKNYSYSSNAVNLLKNNLELPDNTKYYGVNLANAREGRLEYRYIGGKDYQYKTNEILELMDYFIVLTWNSISEQLDEDDTEQLREYLNQNINYFKNFISLENFIGQFPTVSLQVDKTSDSYIVNTQYNSFYDKLYDLVTNVYNLNNCVINYDSDNKKLEVIDASFKVIFDLNYYRFVECSIDSGIFEHSDFHECVVKNAHIETCKIVESDIFNSKLMNCTVDENSSIKNCYFYGGVLNGHMEGGVFRSGTVGESGTLSDDVRIIGDEDDDYFGLAKIATDIQVGKKKIEVKDAGQKKIF